MRVFAAQIASIVALVDHRVAFLALVALIVAPGIPLAFAWARVLPEDPPPFKIEPGSFPSVELEPPPAPTKNRRRDLASVALLACVTLAYLLRFPGIPGGALVHFLDSFFAPGTATWIVFGADTFLLVATGFTACYAVLRPGPLRIPLTAAAALVLILWLLSPLLQLALVAT
jgi:hypothetical protein